MKPPFNPPSWVFGPVWITLYIMMGTAAWRIWYSRTDDDRTRGLAWFAVQFVLNAAWTPVVFGAEQLGWGIAVILPMLIAIAITIFFFHRVDRIAAWLLTPLLVWVGFASMLNIVLWRLNP